MTIGRLLCSWYSLLSYHLAVVQTGAFLDSKSMSLSKSRSILNHFLTLPRIHFSLLSCHPLTERELLLEATERCCAVLCQRWHPWVCFQSSFQQPGIQEHVDMAMPREAGNRANSRTYSYQLLGRSGFKSDVFQRPT